MKDDRDQPAFYRCYGELKKPIDRLRNEKPIDRICAIICIHRLIIDTQRFSRESVRRRTDGRYQVHYLPRFAVDKDGGKEMRGTIGQLCL